MAEDELKPDDIKQETELEEVEEPVLETEESTEPKEDDEPSDDVADPKPSGKLQKFRTWYASHKKVSIPLTVLLAVAVLLGVPLTRYLLLGTVMKQNVDVSIVDAKTNIPVSGVEVSLRGKSAKTNAEGKATISQVKLGKSQLLATKKYYKDLSQTTTVGLKKPGLLNMKLEAIGRQVPIHVTNKLTGDNLADVTIKASDTEAQTDKNGEATLVLPADKSEVDATLSGEKFNNLSVKINVSEGAVKQNTFALTPSGTVYFLSKRTGIIDVVKSDLDGANRKTVLAGTGKEEDRGTVLLASRDWKYLALLSRRDSDKAKLYVIDTSSDQLSEIDSGDASFSLTGWHDHNFVYRVTRNSIQYWQPKQTALKTFNAENKQLTTIDETNAEGPSANDYASEIMGSVYLTKNAIVYSKQWQASYYSIARLSGKRMTINSVKPGGTDKKQLKDFDAGNNGYISAIASEPDEIYFSINNSATSYYEYENGTVAETKDLNSESFNKFYPTYLLSPSGQTTFWYEPRDGKNSLFLGNSDGENGKELASLSEYVTYGWYSDDYLLVSKNSSELYVLPAKSENKLDHITKITDYHKPEVDFLGYGGGYGGI